MTQRWLTVEQAAALLQTNIYEIRRMFRKGILKGIRMGNRPASPIRILEPTDEILAEMLHGHAERSQLLPLFTSAETAAVLGITQNNLKQRVFAKDLACTKVGKQRYFTVKEIRRYARVRDKERNPRSRMNYSAVLMRWLKKQMENIEAPKHKDTDAELEDTLAYILTLDDPERSLRFYQLWQALDTVTGLLKICE